MRSRRSEVGAGARGEVRGATKPPADTFLVERYWPGMMVEGVRARDRLLADAMDQACAIVVETILSTDDEICLWLVEGPDAIEVERAFLAAGIPVDRVAPAIRYRAPVERARSPRRVDSSSAGLASGSDSSSAGPASGSAGSAESPAIAANRSATTR